MDIQIAFSDLNRLAREIDRMRAKIPLALARGLNEGGDKVRTQVQHALQKQTSLIRYASVTSRVRTLRAYGSGAPKSGVGPVGPGSLNYTIVVSGYPTTKPKEFKTSVQKGPGGGVTIVMWGKPHKFQRSFQQAVKGGLRARLGGPRTPIRGFDGPNLAKEAVKDESAKAFFETAASAVLPAVEKHLAKALGGS